MRAAHVPETVGFATKPTLAVEMIERVLAAHVPFAWVAADSVYGVGDIEAVLRRAGKGYVLGVNANHWFGRGAQSLLSQVTTSGAASIQIVLLPIPRRNSWSSSPGRSCRPAA